MGDTKGVIYKGRAEGMNPYKERFAADTKLRTLAEAMKGADVFLGLSVGAGIHQARWSQHGRNPIIFAMANPDPEITPKTPRPSGRTSSWPPAAPTIPTRSTTSSASPSSSAGPSTSAPAASTRR